MTSNEHRKHGKTVKANFGNFGRMEIAILGTPCGEIKALAESLLDRLRHFKVAYVDADHKTEEDEIPVHLRSGSSLIYTDKIKFNRIDFSGSFDRYSRNKILNDYDLVLVNGNHFEASMQIVVVDERKPLEKKLKKISNPIVILKQNEETILPEYLENHLGKDLEIQPMYNLNQVDKVADLIQDMIILNEPRINGLVLAGGKSERMGQDKGLINYHGLPQRDYLYQLMEKYADKTFMSCRPDQVDEFDDSYNILPDSISGLGPFGAILSAFREYPNHAWLVVACDIPLLNQKGIKQLINGRNPSKIATAFFNEETKFPDPLVTIWEPRAYQALLHFLSLGYSCPRKVLINSSTELLYPENPDILLNANSPEDLTRVMNKIQVKS